MTYSVYRKIVYVSRKSFVDRKDLMYTIADMPKKAGIKGPFIHLQLKLYGDDRRRYEVIRRRAMIHAAKEGERFLDTELNKAILDLPGAISWYLSKDERLFFQGKIDENRLPPLSITEAVPTLRANQNDRERENGGDNLSDDSGRRAGGGGQGG